MSDDHWQPIATAPRDGTVIEIKSTFGVKPWFGLFKWGTESAGLSSKDNGPPWRELFKIDPCWICVNRDSHQQDGGWLSWRSYDGRIPYVDPTRGAQDTEAYWMDST